MLDKGIILIGYSGHAYAVAEAALSSSMDLKYYSEVNETINNPYYLEFIGFEKEDYFKGWKEGFSFILGIGDNKLRQEVSNLILSKNKKILNVIHNSASISDKIEIGSGNLIARNAAINPLVVIKNFCILNTGCIIEHECVIENAVHIAPGAVLLGKVTVGERTFVGANSVIKQGIVIGKDVIIGAGSVVLNNVPDGKKIVGNPSREI
ncbi:acetyltransferase [Polaribacter uvawellassae]|uniref:acetyltransferase n=1 Tax=Polaribacter uvawellassae TaxID=3133495 RepID=UPI00321B75AD